MVDSLERQANGRVVELVDTPDSKSGARKSVWVRVPPWLLPTWQGSVVLNHSDSLERQVNAFELIYFASLSRLLVE